MNASGAIHKDWLYAPPQVSKDVFSGETTRLPYPSRIFGLPKTHLLTHATPDGAEHLQFLVWCMGVFVGMRLTTSEAGFLDATPLKPASLTDFILSHAKLPQAIALAESFWQTHHHYRRRTKRIEGIIHALFLSQYPVYLQFERFMYLHTALDACFALTRSIVAPSSSPTHAQRIDWMCQQLGKLLYRPLFATSASDTSTLNQAMRCRWRPACRRDP